MEFDFSSIPEIAAGETLDTLGTIIILPADSTLTQVGSAQIQDMSVFVKVKDGTRGQQYTIIVPVTTSSNNIVTAEERIFITPKPTYDLSVELTV